jgi:hypothetical protein
MMRAFILAVLMLVVPAAVLAAAPTRPCAQPAAAWECFSLIEIRAPDGLVSATFFDNGELLAEFERHGTLKRMLVAQPSGATLYAGLDARELAALRQDPLKNPFAFFMEGAVPVAALLYAFPAGPSSVPQVETQVTVLIGRETCSLSVRTLAPGRFAFTLTKLGGPAIEGIVSTEARAPLPDSFPLGDWNREWGPRLQLLGQLRQAPNLRPD